MEAPTNPVSERPRVDELRRDVSVWGSFMWGFADVGANVFAALGLVVLATQGLAPLAFALAGIVYILIGLAYTELAAAYPVAGGGQYFTLRGLGDFSGFVTGSALLLDYTIDIALFSVICAGYINWFFPNFLGFDVSKFVITIGPFENVQWLYLLESLLLISILIVLNVRGIRESSLLNEIIGVVDILIEGLIVVCGFLFAWRPDFFIAQWNATMSDPNYGLRNFMYGSSLAIISFIGLESISQAAQETRRPATIVPRTSVALIFTVFIFATGFSAMTMGVVDWRTFQGHEGDSVAILASKIPYIGLIAGPLAAFIGATILLISANSGVMSASRLAFSMSQFQCISPWFDKVHARYRTPTRTIFVFTLIGVVQTILSFLSKNAIDTLANMYAFGATLGYTMVFIALLALRFKDPYTPRPYKMPLNVKVSYKGRKVDLPLLGLVGLLGIAIIFIEVVWTHDIGRIAGPAWVVLCFIYYAWYRKRAGLPVLRSVQRNWEDEQIHVLTSAEEYDLLEQYKQALAERDRQWKRTNGAVHAR